MLADFHKVAIAIDKETVHYDIRTFEGDLVAEELKAKSRILLDAILAKTASFVPLQFPVDPDRNRLSPASPPYIEAKVKQVFNKYSQDLTEQTKTAAYTMKFLMKGSADHLPNCERDSTDNKITQIVSNLKKVELEVGQKRTVDVKPGNIKQFWDAFKSAMEPVEKGWNEAAVKQFSFVERVSPRPC